MKSAGPWRNAILAAQSTFPVRAYTPSGCAQGSRARWESVGQCKRVARQSKLNAPPRCGGRALR